MKILKKTLGAAVGAISLLLASNVLAAPMQYDLLTLPGTVIINDGVYRSVPEQPTGTGKIDPFVRLKTPGNVNQGYNTDVIGTYNNFGTDEWNHEIQVGPVGFIDTASGPVMRFLLDINQTGNDAGRYLSLDSVQIYISTIANQSVAVENLANSALVYSMDALEDSFIKLDYLLNNGSGSGDVTLDIPLQMFLDAFAAYDTTFGTYFGTDTDLQNGAYIYLFSRFGDQDGMHNNDGYEEWTHFNGAPIGLPPCEVDCGPNFIPEPNSMLLFGLGLLGSAIAVKRGRRWDRS